jgi:hypothetical protein
MAHDARKEDPMSIVVPPTERPSTWMVRLESLFQAVAAATNKAATSNRAHTVYSTPNAMFVKSTDDSILEAWKPVATVFPSGTVVTHLQHEVTV